MLLRSNNFIKFLLFRKINYTNNFGKIALGGFQFPERLKAALT